MKKPNMLVRWELLQGGMYCWALDTLDLESGWRPCTIGVFWDSLYICFGYLERIQLTPEAGKRYRFMAMQRPPVDNKLLEGA